MITAQQARDVAFKLRIDDDEYAAAVKWIEECVEKYICEAAEKKQSYIFITVDERNNNPIAVRCALNKHGFAVTSAGGDNRLRHYRVSWE